MHWAAFVAEVQDGLVSGGDLIRVDPGGESVSVRYGPDGESLTFDQGHWKVFLDGVRAGEFDL
jgi:hypothetical protein